MTSTNLLVDTHMLSLPGENQLWREQCLSSLSGAAITLHELPGIAGSLGESRAKGFALGNSPYVSFVDPDDLYEATAFAQCAQLLDTCPQLGAVYTAEVAINADGEKLGLHIDAFDRRWMCRTPSHVHGVIVLRRSVVEEFLPQVLRTCNWADWVLLAGVASHYPVAHLPMVGRFWRKHEGNSCKRGDSQARGIVKQFMEKLDA